jgi:uncharacterized protein with PQ loop repeat
VFSWRINICCVLSTNLKLLKTKQAAGISISMYFCSLTGCALWFFYGVIHSVALNIVNISSAFAVIVLSTNYQKVSSNNLQEP